MKTCGAAVVTMWSFLMEGKPRMPGYLSYTVEVLVSDHLGNLSCRRAGRLREWAVVGDHVLKQQRLAAYEIYKSECTGHASIAIEN